MDCTTGIATYGRAVLPNTARAIARVEKSSSGSGLHNEFTAEERPREFAAQRTSQRPLSHSETRTASDCRGAPFSSPFVAQLLGQVLGRQEPDRILAGAAYAKTRRVIAAGALFDGKA